MRNVFVLCLSRKIFKLGRQADLNLLWMGWKLLLLRRCCNIWCPYVV